jgi:DNA repair exonuclease SbcCD nuclease subunit
LFIYGVFMAKICLISDTHFGHKNDSILFHKAFVKFYDDIFFPELQRRGIKTVVHLGDLFDRRKYINFHILHRTRIDFLQKLVDGGYDTHIIIGNHDTYFKDTNDVNSITELIHMRYPNFQVYEETQEIVFDKLRVLIVPWLNTTNMGPGLEMIAKSKATVCFGHLEIAGFNMSQTQVCEHGMDRAVFKRFKKVLSGHFHHPNSDGKIQYLGSPYEMTFADLDDPRGFYIFDTDTLELEFIQNPYKMFYRLVYDDRKVSFDGSAEDEKVMHAKADNKELGVDYKERYEDKFLKIVVAYKTDPVAYEKWIDQIIHADPAEHHIHDMTCLEVAEEADDQFLEFDENNKIVVVSDTLTIINKYVDAIGIEVDKDKLKSILRELYIEAEGSHG